MLDTESISSFVNGAYLDWKVSGDLVIKVSRTAGNNAVLNGVFLDPPPAATFIKKDTATQGTWIGTYGGQGYDIVSGPKEPALLRLGHPVRVSPPGPGPPPPSDPLRPAGPRLEQPRRRRLVLPHQLHR